MITIAVEQTRDIFWETSQDRDSPELRIHQVPEAYLLAKVTKQGSQKSLITRGLAQNQVSQLLLVKIGTTWGKYPTIKSQVNRKRMRPKEKKGTILSLDITKKPINHSFKDMIHEIAAWLQ